MELFLFCICFGTTCCANIFAVVIGTTISIQYRLMLSLTFLDVYGRTSLLGQQLIKLQHRSILIPSE